MTKGLIIIIVIYHDVSDDEHDENNNQKEMRERLFSVAVISSGDGLDRYRIIVSDDIYS
jgi:hypothetical protein